MMLAGIIDPTKVERVALQHAASIASLLLTTEVLITEGSEAGRPTHPWRTVGSFKPDRGDQATAGRRA